VAYLVPSGLAWKVAPALHPHLAVQNLTHFDQHLHLNLILRQVELSLP
jgi:hypothetical protein